MGPLPGVGPEAPPRQRAYLLGRLAPSAVEASPDLGPFPAAPGALLLRGRKLLDWGAICIDDLDLL